MPHECDHTHVKSSKVTFHLRTLGACVLSLAGESVKLNTRKSLALLAYLALTPTNSESRIRLAGLLWGESPEDKARTSLRQVVAQLSDLKTPSGQPLIFADRHEIRLNIGSLSVDVIEAMDELSRGIVPESFLAMHHFEDAFLSPIENIDHSFAAWLHQKRAALRNEFVRKLSTILARAASPEEMLRVSSAVLNLDNVNEPACRAFMRASYLQGDATGALRLYNELWQALQSEFDTEPDVETQNLVAAIKKGEAPTGPDAALAAAWQEGRQGRKSIETEERPPRATNRNSLSESHQLRLMVGNFTPFSENPGFSIKASALRSETLLSLTRFRELQVIDGNTGENTGRWDFSVTCEVFQERKNVNIIFKIYRATTGLLVWSERLSLPDSALPEGAACTANRIAAMVQRIIKSARLSEIDDSIVASLDIQSRLLRAQHSFMQWDKQEERLARKLWLSILADNAQIASAHVGYSASISTSHLVFPGELRNPESIALIVDHAAASINIDPLDSRSHLANAWALNAVNAFQRSTNAFRHAVSLNKADSWSFISAAEGVALGGEVAASAELLDVFLEHRVPLREQHWAYLTIIRFLHEDFESAFESSRNCPLPLNMSGAWGAAALALLGREDEARDQASCFMAQARAAWSVNTTPSDEAVGLWIMQGLPIALPKHRKTLVEGLRRAGFTVS